MKKVSKAMYGKSMMKKGGMKKMADGGGVGRSQASGGKGSPSDMTPNSSSGAVNGPNTVYAPGKKKTGDSTKSYKTGGSTKYQAGGMKKANTMNPTSRNTAMTALGVKKKSNASSPSRFGENAVPTTGTKKMQKGGNWVDKNIVDPANRWLDKNFRNPVNKKIAVINKKIDKNFRNPVNKKVAKISKSVDRNFTNPVNKYIDENLRGVAKKAATKKTVSKKPVIKKTVTVKPKKA